MNKVIRNQKGFTLLEIIVVLAVLGALAAMLSPVVFRYIDDANRARAASDTRTIAAAVQQMYKDTGRWPYHKVGNAQFAHTAADDAAFLTSASVCDLADTDLATCDVNEPDAGAATGWDFTGLADSLTNQLIKGSGGTAYVTTGSRGWKGPYLEAVPATDAWGRSYVVNIAKADTTGNTAPEVVVVLSAGANGIIETNGDTLATAGNFTAGGDDIIARVK